jgi:hypothetical protein
MAETFFDCLRKLAAATVPTAAEARDALKRINDLEATKPTAEQMLRYGTLGGASGLGIGAVTDMMRGKIPYKPTDAAGGLLKGRAALVHVGRNVAADFAKGALGGGAVPLLRHHVDRDVEMQRLRAYVESRPKKAVVAPPPEAPPPPVPQMQPNLMGGLSTGAEASPSLGGMKVAGVPLTPAGRLAHSSRMGKTPSSTNSGPSIADQVKPIGFGRPLPGATKGT